MSLGLLSYGEAAGLVAAFAARLKERDPAPAAERVPLAEAAGRVLAEPLCADRDQPPFARSTRDGFACRAAEASTHHWLPIAGATRAGEAAGGPLPPLAAWEIMTGAPTPLRADAVAMVEHVEVVDGRVRLLPPRTLTAGENLVAQGAQARAGDVLAAAGADIGFGQIALAAECGAGRLAVYRRPRVAILATGDELVAVEATPGPGQIRNSNAPMLAVLVAAAGGAPWVLPRAADTAEALDAALAEALGADLLLISGGVSAGKFDLAEPALEQLGATFHFTGVRMQPGKPVVFGELPRAAAEGQRAGTLPFFGLPGNPISSAVTFLLFAAPVLGALAGRAFAGGSGAGPRFALARLAGETGLRVQPGLTRFLPAACSFGGDAPEVTPVAWQGSGDLAAQARSNCYLVIPEEAAGLAAGATVKILLC